MSTTGDDASRTPHWEAYRAHPAPPQPFLFLSEIFELAEGSIGARRMATERR